MGAIYLSTVAHTAAFGSHDGQPQMTIYAPALGNRTAGARCCEQKWAPEAEYRALNALNVAQLDLDLRQR